MPSSASVSRSNCVGIDRHVAGQMQFHVDQRAGQILDRVETLVERLGLLDLVQQFLRHRFARLVMDRELLQDLGRRQPVFVQLRRKLNIVAGHRGSRLRRIIRVAAKSVQRMAELVKQRDRVIPRNQNRLAFLAFDEVRIVGNDRRDRSVDVSLESDKRSSRHRCVCRAGHTDRNTTARHVCRRG